MLEEIGHSCVVVSSVSCGDLVGVVRCGHSRASILNVVLVVVQCSNCCLLDHQTYTL